MGLQPHPVGSRHRNGYKSHMHTSVCVSSYQRPELLRRTLLGLSQQEGGGEFEYSIVVCDNDPAESARPVVEEISPRFSSPIAYCVERRKGIAHCRNTALAHAAGDLIAFIDDDEVPKEDWLLRLHETLRTHQVSGVLGPVRPMFDSPPPEWIVRGRLCERKEHPTGFLLPWEECRTGNVLFKKEIIRGIEPVFLPEYVTGSDANFFLRMSNAQHEFVWCNEAVVYEVVPPARWRRSFMVKRALLRGPHRMKMPSGKLRAILKALVAIPVYAVMLPFLQLLGHHRFMKYLIKWCDHVGTLLAFLRIELVSEREV